MMRTHAKAPRFLPLLMCLLLLPAACGASGSETYYPENGWNYVDGAMPVDAGIPEDASGALGRIQRNRILRVAMDAEKGPYARADEQLAQTIAEKMGVTLRIIPLESGRVLPALLEDQCDLSISALSFTPGRSLAYTMSAGYYFPEETPQVGVLMRAAEPVQSLEDLKGRILIAQSNSLAETIGARQVHNYLEYRRAPTAQGVYEAVAQGTAYAGLVSLDTAAAWLEKYPDSGLCLAEGLRYTPDAPYLGFRVAAKKGENQLIAFVNGVISQLQEKSSYASWLQE